MRRPAFLALCLGIAAICVAYASAFLPAARQAGTWAMIAGLALLCSAMIALAVSDGPRLRILRGTLVALVLCLAGGFAFAVLGPEGDPRHPQLLFGLPVPTMGMILLVGVIPLVGLPIAYALTFPHDPRRDA